MIGFLLRLLAALALLGASGTASAQTVGFSLSVPASAVRVVGVPGLVNFKPTAQFTHFRSCLLAVAAHTDRCRVINPGPSNARGWICAASDMRRCGWFYQLAGLMSARGVPSTRESFLGAGNGANIYGGNGDLTMTFSSGWYPQTTDATITSNSRSTIGGRPFGNSTTVTGLLFNVGVSEPWNRAEVISEQATGLGTWKWTAPNSGSNISGAGTTALVKNTLATGSTAAAQSMRFVRVSGAVYLQGVIFYDAAIPAVDFVNIGNPGSGYQSWLITRANFLVSAVSQLPIIGYNGRAPDLALIQMGLGEYISGDDPATLQASAIDMITQIKAQGTDVLFFAPTPPQESFYANRAWAPYVEALRAAAAATDVPFFDTRVVVPVWSADCYADEVHLNALCHGRVAAALDRILRAAVPKTIGANDNAPYPWEAERAAAAA